jgi:sugar phosphate isomerase/epimerase
VIKISMGSWAFAFGPYADDPIPLEDVVARLSEAEYDGIELSGFPPHATLDRYPNHKSRAELTRMLADYGLGVSGYAADFSMVNPVVNGNKQNYIDLFHRTVDLCVDVGSPFVRVDTVAPPGSVPEKEYLAAIDRVADTWADAAEIAARGKVRMVWEFEPAFWLNRPSEVAALHRKVAHPNFRILFDMSHAYMCSVTGARQHGHKETVLHGVPELLKKFENKIGALHLNDSDGTLYRDETSTHCPFGEGYIDFRSLAPQLLDLENIDWWCIDLCFWPGAWDLIEESRDFVLDLVNTKPAA